MQRRRSARWSRQVSATPGQTLVEFALTLMLFMTLVVGLVDGVRVIFYYSQIQEAAREGARWGSVQVARAIDSASATPWGTFGDPGNKPGIYCDNVSGSNPSCLSPGSTAIGYTYYSLQASRAITMSNVTTNTIVGATVLAATAVDLRTATITVTSTVNQPAATEVMQINPALTNQSVGVTVRYPFKPLLSIVFGGVTIWLQGNSTMLHE